MDLIGLLIAIIILCVVVYAISLLLDMIQVPAPMKQLVWLVIFVVILIIILSWLSGGFDSFSLNGTNNQRVR